MPGQASGHGHPESCVNGLVLLIPLLLVVGIGGNHGKTPKSSYPVTLDVDYPERLNRLTTAFRIILILPILGILLLISGPHWSAWPQHHRLGTFPFVAGGIIFLPTLLMILFRWKYPRWWFDWNLGIAKFAARVTAYVWLLTDEYPSTDAEQAVHVNIPYPDVQKDLKA